MAQNSLNQSYLSILTSVELVSQICLIVGLYVYLFLCMFHHLLRMTKYFFSETLHMDFWVIAEVVTVIKRIHTCWGIFAHFCVFVTFFLFLRTVKHFLFLVLLWWSLRQKNHIMVLSAVSHFGVIWGSFYVLSYVSWETFNIFSGNFIQILFVLQW